MILAMDGGTTNTRITLVRDKTPVDRIKLPIGAGSTAKTGSNQLLKEAIADGIGELLRRNSIEPGEVEKILVSGMLTSELGLYNLPHKVMPAGTKDLAQGAVTVSLPEIFPCPVTFLPGLKNDSAGDFSRADMMRGEETELVGLMDLTGIKPPFTAVLPGTHTKLVKVNQGGQMELCRTTLGGELLAAIPQNTVLKSSVVFPLLQVGADMSYLQRGVECSRKLGLSSAAFKTRVLVTTEGVSPENAGVFLAGVLLEPDLVAIAQTAGSDPILLGGSEPLRGTCARLIADNLPNRLIVAEEVQVEHSTVCGALCISECQDV